jgi:mRNA turnover protein 4
VLRYFSKFSHMDFAKAGAVPDETISVPAGPLSSFPVTMIDELRKLGLVVEADNGAVVLRSDTIVASAGVPLTPEQARLLMKLDMKIVNFKICLIGEWAGESFTAL